MKTLFITLSMLISMLISIQTFACPDVSGRYIYTSFSESDFRSIYCVSIAQNDCHTLTSSNWSMTMKNGKVDKVDMSEFPPNTFTVDDPVSYMSMFKLAAAGECAQ